MSDRVDHAAAAERIISEIPDDLSAADTAGWLAEAQLHASLAIADQLRQANLIAMLDHVNGDRYESRVVEIEEALGIE